MKKLRLETPMVNLERLRYVCAYSYIHYGSLALLVAIGCVVVCEAINGSHFQTRKAGKSKLRTHLGKIPTAPAPSS